jgi:hypothetical protein
MLIENLKESPGQLPLSSRFTVLCGIIYMGAGTLLMVWPGSLQTLMFATEFVGREAALMRVLGMTLAIIGWFYFIGGRSSSKQIVAASVLDRIVLVPLVLIPLAVAGVFPVLLGTFAVLDPALGFIAWYLLAKEQRKKNHDSSQTSA